jgi:phosphoenolpyruvate carboxykinase (GTP)
MRGVSECLSAPRCKFEQEIPILDILEKPDVATPQRRHAHVHPGDLANEHVHRFVHQALRLCVPDRIYWCNGSSFEREKLTEQAVAEGVLIPLNAKKLPGCCMHRSNRDDVARSEQYTFVCTPSKDTTEPTNNWMQAKEAYARLEGLFKDCMKGRTMYVVPFAMGPVGSRLEKVVVQITDSIDVALSIGLTTRMGDVALKALGDSDEFSRYLHSVGDCNPEHRYVCHFPFDNTVWSFGSDYGGNALLVRNTKSKGNSHGA